MPTPYDILNGLTAIADRMVWLAVVWHIIIGAEVVGLIAGWRPSRKLAATLLALPLVSVGILALVFGNPFNGILFLVFSGLLAWFGLHLPNDKPSRAPLWSFAFGVVMIAFAWIYPHFVPGSSWLKYLYAAPTGLIPCPTLSLVVGFALLTRGFSSRAWSLALVVIGLFYGLFGALRLGVRIDFLLLIGTLLLAVQIPGMKSNLARSADRP
ncbi:MAG: hypothetical protein ACYDH0_06410 [Candidatus Aminicenantales bacterium]